MIKKMMKMFISEVALGKVLGWYLARQMKRKIKH